MFHLCEQLKYSGDVSHILFVIDQWSNDLIIYSFIVVFAILTSVPFSIRHIRAYVKFVTSFVCFFFLFQMIRFILCRSYKNNTGYNRTFSEAVRPLISPTILFISSTWWALASPHMILEKQPRIFFSAVGTTFSNIAVRQWKRIFIINWFIFCCFLFI